MALPETSATHVDAALSQISISYKNPSYICGMVAPVVPVAKQSDKFYTFNKGDLLRNDAGVRAPGTVANRGGYRLSTTTFFCDNYAFGKARPYEVDRNADAALQIDQADTEYVTEQLMIDMELACATALFTTSVWATDNTTATNWDTYATSTPIEDVRAAADVIQGSTGVRPNQLTIGRQVWTVLQDHPDLVDRLSNTATKQVRLDTVASLFEVDRILIGDAVYNTAAEADAASMSYVWGKNALLNYVPSSPGLRTPSASYTFQWGNRFVRNYEEEAEMQSVVEAHDYVDFVATASDLGYFFSGIVT